MPPMGLTYFYFYFYFFTPLSWIMPQGRPRGKYWWGTARKRCTPKNSTGPGGWYYVPLHSIPSSIWVRRTYITTSHLVIDHGVSFQLRGVDRHYLSPSTQTEAIPTKASTTWRTMYSVHYLPARRILLPWVGHTESGSCLIVCWLSAHRPPPGAVHTEYLWLLQKMIVSTQSLERTTEFIAAQNRRKKKRFKTLE